jgi:hypothetical protein
MMGGGGLVLNNKSIYLVILKSDSSLSAPPNEHQSNKEKAHIFHVYWPENQIKSDKLTYLQLTFNNPEAVRSLSTAFRYQDIGNVYIYLPYFNHLNFND